MHCLEAQSLVGKVVPPMLIVEFQLGLPGNLVALWIFSCRMNDWKSNTVYLLNLLIADFLLLVSLPFRIDTLLRGENWVFGDAWCRINLFMLAVNRSASIGFLTIVAVDRYFKVVHPHHQVNRITTVQAGILCGTTWAVVLALRLPLLAAPLMQTSQDLNISLCRSFSSYSNPSLIIRLHYAVYILEFLLPFMLLIFCSLRIFWVLHSRQLDKKQQVKRAIQVVLLIVAVFTICFLPGIASGLAGIFILIFKPKDCASYRIVTQFFSMSLGFTYLNSTLDPLIYCFSSSIFRNTLKTSLNALGICHFKVSSQENMSGDD
ncbi:hydroxycarboxylic acid receptor 2-like [Anguilla rostrata]|uniref:hydroxycarboxylic acid receptor 2-like n=1 Tax=Anguilla rostrata TaxID=7938 RepID=UPI0030D0A008